MPRIAAHITGTVSKIEKREGDPVEAGEVLLVLESMKMEIPVLAEYGGVVAEIRVTEGDVVQEGDVLVVLA